MLAVRQDRQDHLALQVHAECRVHRDKRVRQGLREDVAEEAILAPQEILGSRGQQETRVYEEQPEHLPKQDEEKLALLALLVPWDHEDLLDTSGNKECLVWKEKLAK